MFVDGGGVAAAAADADDNNYDDIKKSPHDIKKSPHDIKKVRDNICNLMARLSNIGRCVCGVVWLLYHWLIVSSHAIDIVHFSSPHE